MTFKEIATMLSGINIPYAYYQFEEGTAIEPPFICFYFVENNDFTADNTNYQKIERLVVELYTDQKDFTLEQTVETTLNNNGIVFRRFETPIPSEHMNMVSFEADVVITDEPPVVPTETTED